MRREAGKRGIRSVAVATFAAAFLSATSIAHGQDNSYGVLVRDLLKDVRDTLIRVRTGASGELQLKSATLTLQAVASVDAKGKVSLWVVSLGGGVKQDSTQTIPVSLKPPQGAGCV